MKKLLVLFLAAALSISVFAALSFSSAAENEPSVSIAAYNLAVADNVYISYAVKTQNADSLPCGLLVWSAYQDEYTYDNAEFRLSPAATHGDYTIFEFKNIALKHMTDDFYAVAYVSKGGAYYYSDVKKYSILQYAYNKLGYTGERTSSENLAVYLASMLSFGAEAQKYENYRTDRLATDPYSQVKTVNGALFDGLNYGLYRHGEQIELSAYDTENSVNWSDHSGVKVSETGSFTLTVGTSNEVYTAERAVNLLVFGDSMVGGYNVIDIFANMASADNIRINKSFTISYANHRQDKTGTYNLYELVNYANENVANSPVTGIKNATLNNALTQTECPIDYFIYTVSRDRDIALPKVRQQDRSAFLYIEKELLKQNPDAKIVLLSPPGFRDGSPDFDNKIWPVSSALPSRTSTDHNEAVKALTAEIAAAANAECIIANVGDAFELHYRNGSGIELYGDALRHNSPAGAFLTACVLYSSVFGNPVSGIDEAGFLPTEDAALLRYESDISVFGEASVPDVLRQTKNYFGTAVPDPRFTNEEYPAHFDAFLSTAYAYKLRERFVQYDQLGMERVRVTFGRRRTSYPYNAPEAATSQSKLYIDCSSFAYAVLLNAFNYDIGADRTRTLMEVKPGELLSIPYEWTGSAPGALSPAAAIENLISSIRPGDVLSYSNPDNSIGHTMLYIGNGQFIHCGAGEHTLTSLGADYCFNGLIDFQELPSPLSFDNIDILIKSTGKRYLFRGDDDIRVRLLRPAYDKLNPTEAALARMNNLSEVLVYKETSAPNGVTVNPGDDVIFNIVMQNFALTSKTVAISETLPAGLTLKSGSNSFEAILAPGEKKTFSYTVTVDSEAADGDILLPQSFACGVPLNLTPINVKPTLTAAQQAGISGEINRISASTDLGLVTALYKDAFSYTLPFKSKSDILSSMVSITPYNGKPSASLISSGNSINSLLVKGFYGGQNLYAPIDESDRVTYLYGCNFIPGDILAVFDDETGTKAQLYIVDSGNLFVTVRDGKLVRTDSESGNQLLLESLFGKFCFFVLRPSMGFAKGFTPGGLIPESGSLDFPQDMLYEYNILFFGDGFTSAHNMGDIVMKFAEADGIKLNFSTSSWENIGATSTFNLYEAFNWDGTGADSKITGIKSSTFLKYTSDPETRNLNYFIYMVSRDRGLAIAASEARNITAAAYITDLLNRYYPAMQTVLLAPAGYLDGAGTAAAPNLGIPAKTFSEHNALINAYTQKIAKSVTGSQSSVLITDAFEYFMDNYASSGTDLYDQNRVYPSMAGSYYMACVLYSSLFGNASSGIAFYGNIEDHAAAELLQGAADEYVTRVTGKSLTPHTRDYAIKPMTAEQIDPRNHPTEERFSGETYPENYDYLLASSVAYFQRENWVQYDNLNMDKVNKTFSRRTIVNAAPEDATPQSLLYTDCSAYLYACFSDTFDWGFYGGNRCNSIFDNPSMQSCRAFYWRQRTDTRTAQQASDDFYSVLQPGDIIVFTNESRDGSVGHIMLYLGNGTMIHSTGRHATGGGENYIYKNGTDDYEMITGVLLDSIDEVGKPGSWLCPFENKDWLCAVFRPFDIGLTPTENAKNRLNSLRNVVAYKETSAPEGVTVSPGEDVTFTFVIRNLENVTKTINITDTLSNGLTFKSGDAAIKLSGNSLSATLSVPAYETVRVSYTVTVNKDVPSGTLISCRNSYINGVLHNDAPICVAKTLSPLQQTQFRDDLAAAGQTAKSDIELVLSLYESLPFKTKAEAVRGVFTAGSGDFVSANTSANSINAMLAWNLFGGQGYRTVSTDRFDRIKHISCENFVAGDILLTADDKNGYSAQMYVYSGDGRFATVKDGAFTLMSSLKSQALCESLLSKLAFCVLRPSISLSIKSVSETTGLATYDRNSIHVSFFGDGFLCGDTANYFGALCFESGRPINSFGGGFTVNNIGRPRVTYSPYELFTWTGTNAGAAITGVSNTRLSNLLSSSEPKVDFFLISSGRDVAITNSSIGARSTAAVKEINRMLKEQNPDGELVIVVPPAYLEGGCNYITEVLTKIITRDEQKALIKEYAQKLSDAADGSKIIWVDDAFYFFEDNYSDSGITLFRDDRSFQNEAGAYYAALVIYAELFGASPYGLEFGGYLTDGEKALLQTAAYEFVFGRKPAESDKCTPVIPVQPVFENDTRFEGEVYPENFDALMVTALSYFERHLLVQYDQLSPDRISKVFYRRSLGDAPEEATSQKTLYFDCTSFVWSLLKTAYDYELPANRSRPLTYNDLGDIVAFEIYTPQMNMTQEEAVAAFLSALQPGDVVAYSNPDNSRGHGFIYLGNGYIMQCSSASRISGGSADYQFESKMDSHEGMGGVRIDKIDMMSSPLKSSYQFDPKYDMTIRIIRPDYSKLTPTQETKNRIANLQHIVAYKETSAPEGVTVNPGGTVDITVVIKNMGTSSKSVTVTDILPESLTLKSGSNNFTVTAAPGETKKVSYTLEVNSSAALGSIINYSGTKAGGVTLNNTPVNVRRTLTASEQEKLISAADSVKTASDPMDFISNVYGSLGITLPFASLDDAFSSTFKTGPLADSLTFNTGSEAYEIIAPAIFCGYNLVSTDNTNRLKYISYYNLVPGDVLFIAAGTPSAPSFEAFLYVGGAAFKTVENGGIRTISNSINSQELLERIFGETAVCVYRPSLAL